MGFDSSTLENSIAVVGMACSLPDADSPEAFWANIAAGVESVVFPDDDELIKAGVSPRELSNPDYVKATVPFRQVKEFDASFFGFTPKEARVMDPQHRKFLETCWNAFEHAGHTPASCDGAIGVFAGSGMNWYFIRNVMNTPNLMDEMGVILVRHLSNDKDFLSTQVSYQMDLKGPSVNIQTACSTSLVAIHTACQSLLNGECEMALAGGCTIDNPLDHGYLFRDGEVLSADGHCAAFDEQSSGTLFGSGAGAVLLRPLEDAIRENDTIHAVIRGSAINNDGANKISYLAPSVDGQAAAMSEAIELSDVDPATIRYVEAHGTGTRLGDPIEIAALTAAFGHLEERDHCAIGSVKTNIGHLDTAAGIASFIKAVEALKHQQLPPSLNFKNPNAEINFKDSPFYVSTELADWAEAPYPRRAAVNSLGVGGTNSFVVVEEYPLERREPKAFSKPQALLLSAKTEKSLAQRSADLAKFLENNPDVPLQDVAFTLRNGRVPMAVKGSVAIEDRDQAISMLASGVSSYRAPKNASVVFMFPGAGAQYPNMAKALYEAEEEFRENMDRCFDILAGLGREDVRDAIYPEAGNEESAAETLQFVATTQPALFCIEYSLAATLISRGVEPDAMIGHSSGEYVAACLAGVFSLESAIELMCHRGRLVATLQPSAMIAVSLPEADAFKYESEDLSVASINGPELTVLAGASESVERVEKLLSDEGVMVRRIQSSHGGHNHFLEEILEEFHQCVLAAQPKTPNRKFISNLTGNFITESDAADPDYWCKHFRRTVLFQRGLDELQASGHGVFIEVGPGTTLTQFVNSSLAQVSTIPAVPHPKDKTPSQLMFYNIPGALWANGIEIDWDKWQQDPDGQRATIPVYPFLKDEHWLERQEAQASVSSTGSESRNDLGDWFYTTDWRLSPIPQVTTELAPFDGKKCLVFCPEEGGDFLAAVQDMIPEARLVFPSEAQTISEEGATWRINPGLAQHYDALLESVSTVDYILYAWSLPLTGEHEKQYCFDAPFLLAGALQKTIESDDQLNLWFITQKALAVGPEVDVVPMKSLIAGPARVLPREVSGVSTRWVDLASDLNAFDQIMDEYQCGDSVGTVAYRGINRYEPDYRSVSLEPVSGSLRKGGSYLITGAFGGLGFLLSEYLAEHYGAKLYLTSRSAVTPDIAWQFGGDLAFQRGCMIERLKSLGAEVSVIVGDHNTDVGAQLKEQGVDSLDGVFHVAGAVDDGLIGIKTLESTESVLAPKVSGTRMLDSIVEATEPEFCVYFSSVSSFVGIQGQVDYTSANMFLDTHASKQNGSSRTRHVAIDWSVWRDAGLASLMAAQMGVGFEIPADCNATTLPILNYARREDNLVQFYGLVTGDSSWVLNEHRTRAGVAVVPGTGYIDMLYSAMRSIDGNLWSRMTVEDLIFMSPVALSGIDRRIIQLELDFDDEGTVQAIFRSYGETADDMLEHVSATVKAYAGDDVAELSDNKFELEQGRTHKHPETDFGEHWECITAMGTDGDLAAIQLETGSEEQLERYPLHPGLLDMATGSPQTLLAHDELMDGLVPFRYRELHIAGPLQTEMKTVARRLDTVDEEVGFDLDIQAGGACVVKVRGFELRVARQRQQSAFVQGSSAAAGTPSTLSSIGFELGITNLDGMKALETILSYNMTHAIVSPIDIAQLINQVGSDSSEEVAIETEERSPRPEISVPYAEPVTDQQRAFLEVWEDALGISGLGINDNFFELGGHSLLLTRVVTRLKKSQQIQLPLEEVFDKATVLEWSELASQETADTKPVISLKKVDRTEYKR